MSVDESISRIARNCICDPRPRARNARLRIGGHAPAPVAEHASVGDRAAGTGVRPAGEADWFMRIGGIGNPGAIRADFRIVAPGLRTPRFPVIGLRAFAYAVPMLATVAVRSPCAAVPCACLQLTHRVHTGECCLRRVRCARRYRACVLLRGKIAGSRMARGCTLTEEASRVQKRDGRPL